MITFLSVALTATTCTLASLYMYAETKRRQVENLRKKNAEQRDIIQRQARQIREKGETPAYEAELQIGEWHNF